MKVQNHLPTLPNFPTLGCVLALPKPTLVQQTQSEPDCVSSRGPGLQRTVRYKAHTTAREVSVRVASGDGLIRVFSEWILSADVVSFYVFQSNVAFTVPALASGHQLGTNERPVLFNCYSSSRTSNATSRG